MEKPNHIQKNKHTKILVPATSFDLETDRRLLIPFTSGDKIGFINNKEEIIVKAKYSMYYGDIYSEEECIKVALVHTYGFPRSDGSVSIYQKPIYGLIDSQGHEIIKPIYFSLLPSINGKERLFTVQRFDYTYGVIDINGNEVIPFGKYSWIDGFDHGFTRVKGEKWGINNEHEEEILPIEYDKIWNFYDKPHTSVHVERDGKISYFTLPKKPAPVTYHNNDYDYETHFGEYSGSYAQDVMDYSDDLINDAFEGDPDAYWNID